MSWEKLLPLMQFLKTLSKKERGSVMDHTFILVAGIYFVNITFRNISQIETDDIFEAVLVPSFGYMMTLGIILGSLVFCGLSVKKFL